MNRRLAPAPARTSPAWCWLTTGVPLTLLLDLAAGGCLDSRAVLADEQFAALVAAAWSDAERGAGSAWGRAGSA